MPLAGAALVTMCGTLLAAAAPAAADTAIEVDAGYADGQIVPGRPVPVRVEVRSDQLATGTLTATPYALGEAGESVSAEVEVAGGSVKEYLLVMPTAWSGAVGPSEVRVTLTTDDETVTGTDALGWNDTVESVGLLPGLASQVPEPVPLPMGLGRAMFAQLDADLLATPGALGPLGSIVTGPDGISSLPPGSQDNVLAWVEDGGQLLVDAPPGSPVAGLPEEWQPAGARAAAGDGWVRLTDGAAARGRWADIIEPTRQFGPQLTEFSVCCPPSVPDSVARDAGLRVPDIGWLVGFLAAYVVVVGPVTFLLIRRSGRTTLTWVAVPLVAVLFTGVAFVAGTSLRAGAGAAHGTVVQTSPLGDRVATYVGIVSRDGTDPTGFLPEGWQAGGLGANALLASGNVTFDESGRPVSGFAEPEPVAGHDGRPGFRLPLNTGDFGIVAARGRLDEENPLSVTATAAGGGAVRGTVTNSSDVDLTDTIVVVADTALGVGPVGAGETVEWELGADLPAEGRDPWMAVERPWGSAIGDMGEIDFDSPVNYAVYAAELAGDVDSYPPGIALAAGWTDDWAPPVEIGGGMEGGRTVIVARSVVAAEPGTLPAAAVRREFVRGPVSVQLDGEVAAGELGPAAGAIARFTLPEGTDPATPLALDASGAVARAEVWSGGRWVELALAEASGPDQGAGAFPVGDPTGPMRVAPLPAGAVANGTVYVRAAVRVDAAPRITLQVRGAS